MSLVERKAALARRVFTEQMDRWSLDPFERELLRHMGIKPGFFVAAIQVEKAGLTAASRKLSRKGLLRKRATTLRLTLEGRMVASAMLGVFEEDPRKKAQDGNP